MPAPRTTARQISKGTAPRRAAEQREKTAASKAKLDALKERQDQATVTPIRAAGGRRDQRARVAYHVDGKAVAPTQNTLAHVTRVTGTKDASRWTTKRLREFLATQGVADPVHEPFEVQLPNGRVLAGVLS